MSRHLAFDPAEHRVIVRLPLHAPAIGEHLRQRFPGLEVRFLGTTGDCRNTDVELSGLPCLPFCAPGWQPRIVGQNGTWIR